MNRQPTKKDIAIIGVSCKFFKSDNPKQFWENLKEGNELISFYSDEELIDLGVDTSIINNPNFIKLNTILKNSESFDYPFFNYTKDEANLMDPQIRLLHELTWAALEDAGYNPLSYTDKIGMYAAVADNFNWIAHSLISENKNVDPFFLSNINNKNFISTLISYNLNLKGPSVVVDTACSSSLTAVHSAYRSLLLRECSIAIAAGITLSTNKNNGYIYREGLIQSKDGHCRPFDSESSGTTGTEGAAVVVMKRLEDAIKDRDHIYAVMMSSASNNDGNRKVGYTAPSVTGQAECIKMAHAMANVSYNTISYVEAHGTATKLGDPREIDALNKAFNNDNLHKCAIGSVKSNVGHLGHAAGITGLLKTTLALKHSMIPPSLHYKSPNPGINFSAGPFYVNSKLNEWKRTDDTPLRAGVSSFGIGGTNVHVILEEYQKTALPNQSRPFQLVSYAAKSQLSLNNYSTKLIEFVNTENVCLPDLAYTLKVGKANLNYKKIVICEDKEELLSKLNENSGLHFKSEKERNDVIFLFPGQGSQYFKMGNDLYNQEPVFKTIMDNGFQLLFQLTGKDFSTIIGYKSTENLNQINETQYTQPLLFLMEYALASVLIQWEIKPSYMIGHSLGEYTAACIAGVFSFEDALSLVVSRAKLMNDVEKGSMMAVSALSDNVLRLITGNLSIAAINSATSCVVSGTIAEIKDFAEILTQNEVSFSILKTSHAFHSQMMDVILEKYEMELNKIKFSQPKLPFISNHTGKQILDKEATSPKYWVKHLRETVKFKEGIDSIFQHTNPVFIEIGPGNTLQTLVKQNAHFLPKHAAIGLVRHINEPINDNKKFTNAIGEIWSQNIKINWQEYYAAEERNRISLPTYCFDSYKLDFIVDPFEKLMSNDNFQTVKQFNNWFYIPSWKSVVLAKKEEVKKNQNYLIFSDEGKLINVLIDQLRLEGNNVYVVKRGQHFEQLDNHTCYVNPANEVDFKSLFQILEQNEISFEQFVFNWNFENDDQESIVSAFLTLNSICRFLINHVCDSIKKITVVCNLNQEVLGGEKRNISMVSSIKQLYVCAQENPNIFTCNIDIDQELSDSKTLRLIVDELKHNYADEAIAYRMNKRWLGFYEKLDVRTSYKNNYLKQNKTYLITGGLGHVGKIIAKHLCDAYNSKIIIIGRRNIPTEDLWTSLLQHPETDQSTIKSIKDMIELKKKDRKVYYYPADVSDFSVLNQAIENIVIDHGKISGVIHAAGNIDDKTFKPIENLTEQIARKQFSPKIQGTINVYNIFKNTHLDFVWVTSSLSSILGGLGFGAYAVTNAFLDSFVHNKKEKLENWFCINLDGVNDNHIDQQKLIEIFEKTFVINVKPQVIISLRDPNSFKISVDEIKSHKLAPSSNENFLNTTYVAPETEIEIALCEAIKSFFGYQKISVLDNFFEMGGDSLKAMTLIKRLNKLFEIEISIHDFYKKNTIRELAAEVELIVKVVNLQENETRENTIVI